MNPDQLDRRPCSTPLFHTIPTGTYTHRSHDTESNTRPQAPSLNIASISQGKKGTPGVRYEIETDGVPIQRPPSTTEGSQDGNGALGFQERTAETSNPILSRESPAVSNGSMVLLSNQPAIEAPQAGAKGRAHERETRRLAAARIMPSQGLVDAAKGLSRRKGSGRTISCPALPADGYLVDQEMEERERRVRKPNEMLLVGCGVDYERRSRERGRSPPTIYGHVLRDAAFSSPSNIENRFMVDGKWVSGTEAGQLLALHPDGESWRKSPERERRQRERSRLLNENAILKHEVARLEEAAARRGEEEALRGENESLGTALKRLKTESDGKELVEEPAIRRTFSGGLTENEGLWKDAGLGNQPRRSANRGNRVGASLMSQEVMVEHPSAGRGRAREREEKHRLRNLVREPSSSDPDSDNDANGPRRRTNWRTRELTDSEEDRDSNGNKNKEGIDASSDNEHRGRKSFCSAAIVAALSHLPPDVLEKYGPDRPPRIWREHSHEILVEAAKDGGSKGRRREVHFKNEEEAGGRIRFSPPTGLVKAAKGFNGVCDVRDEDDDDGQKLGMWRQEGEGGTCGTNESGSGARVEGRSFP